MRTSIKVSALLILLQSFSLTALYAVHLANPNIKISTTDDCVALWDDTNGTIHSIHSAIKISSGSWSSNAVISTSLDSFSPQLVMNSAGDCAAIWTAIDPVYGITVLYGAVLQANGLYGYRTLLSAIFPNPLTTGGWKYIRQLSSNSELVTQDGISIAINDQGRVRAIWKSLDLATGNTSLYSCAATVNSTWGTPVKLQ